MIIQENKSLKKYNTFGISVNARRFISVNTTCELQEILRSEKNVFPISGGSNMLLTKDIDQLVIHLDIKGITKDSEDENSVYLTVNTGENWHNFVLWSIQQGYGGLENLSLIPGNVGTSPIQNIGAYGVEVKDSIIAVEAVEIESNKLVTFSNEACNFGYRNSIFKNKVKDQYIITAVRFKLSKLNHQLRTSYGAIEKELKERKIYKPTIKDISDVVISIRKSKLPDPKQIGNSGSFFKNPLVPIAHYKKLKKQYPNMPSYPISETEIKIPAGWLIEQSGFKGKRFGDCGVHKMQALVLVNYNNASGLEIYALSKKIQKTIKEKFEIDLEVEVNVIL